MRNILFVARWLPVLGIIMLISGCWSSLDIKQSAIAVGSGIAKAEDGYTVSVEILKPAAGSAPAQPGDSDSSKGSGKSVVLEHTSASLHGSARDFIRDTKRRILYTHNRVWVFDEKIAKQDIMKPIDVLERDQMFRLHSYLMITPDNLKDILDTSPLFKDLSSVELALSMESVSFISDYVTPDFREFLRMITGPTRSAFLPIVQLRKNVKQPITEISGTAVIKEGRMIGVLNTGQTMGLLLLMNQVKGTSITTHEPSGETVQLEVHSMKTTIKPKLTDNQLSANIEVHVRGTLAEIPPSAQVEEWWIKKLETSVSQTVKGEIEGTLKQLQKQDRTDITPIGLYIYRHNPQAWHRVASHWDDIFANANFKVQVETEINHQGLVNRTWGHVFEKPQYNPFNPRSWKLG